MDRRLLIPIFTLILGALIVGTLASFSKHPQPAAPISLDDKEWRLLIDGFVQHPLNLTLEELVAMPKSIVDAKLYCVDNPTTPVAQGSWTGVRLELLLEEAGVAQEAVKVAFYASDGYTTDLTVTTAMRDDIIIAYARNGEPLPETLRLVVPGKWGYKWISELTHIELVNYDFKGKWESRGYTDEADIPSNP
jgi:DMSO/TMAO reductase YedYZ molybdopterin-dependent catalytic subunit